jgi:hypothetical protein
VGRVCAEKTEYYLCFALFNLALAAYPTQDGAPLFFGSVFAAGASPGLFCVRVQGCLLWRAPSIIVWSHGVKSSLGAAQNVLGVGNEAD